MLQRKQRGGEQECQRGWHRSPHLPALLPPQLGGFKQVRGMRAGVPIQLLQIPINSGVDTRLWVHLVRIPSPSEFPAQPEPEAGSGPGHPSSTHSDTVLGSSQTRGRDRRGQRRPLGRCAVTKHPQFGVCEENFLMVLSQGGLGAHSRGART